MFQGASTVTLDDKGRIAIPSVHREQVTKVCANRLVIAYNPFERGCLWIFPEREWERLRDEINALPRAKAVHRNLQMKLVGAAALVEPDGNWRIPVPASQRAAAGLEKHAVLLGMGDKFELWSEQAHLEKINETITEDQITEDMLDLKL
ncbi:division/cell wall cluster transcriptional repressor MraZ [Dokdonella sp.]|uniref:division/cell wall cluster transcriptional repressor MraZ n=1 Tax=Dokdonella sp. TaxID=2291710 RepID=UPI0031BDDEA0|nr:division/cell wall cluster transcriptional repressor MraZ [Dokdonella sp.]